MTIIGEYPLSPFMVATLDAPPSDTASRSMANMSWMRAQMETLPRPDISAYEPARMRMIREGGVAMEPYPATTASCTSVDQAPVARDDDGTASTDTGLYVMVAVAILWSLVVTRY